MTFRVLVADSMAQEGIEEFKTHPRIEVLNRAGISREELLAEIPSCHGLVVRSRTEVDEEVLKAATNLQVVGRAGIGVDNINVSAATRAGIVVMNTPDGNAITTAEHTLSLIFAMSRKIPQATASMKEGKWEKKRFMGRELYSKTLGIIGLGNIGRIVADRAQGLKMKVVAFDPFFSAEAAAKIGVELLPVDEVLKRADVLTCHTPLNDQTRGLVSDAQLDMMKPGVMLVNCARGGIYDEDALVRGLETGKIGALALDVFIEEPPAGDHPLLKHENVVATPHLGASTQEAQVNVAVAVAEQISEFLGGEPARNAINMPRLSASELRVLGPHLDLADRLGVFCSQLSDVAPTKIEVSLNGDIPQTATGPLGTAAVAGVLRLEFDLPVNAVNARLLADERGITMVVSQSEQELHGYAATISVKIQNEAGTFSVVGTLVSGNDGRVVAVNGIPLEAIPAGHLLLIENEDQPGVIGHIGTKLGNAGVNISRMQLGLNPQTGKALSIVSVDQAVSREIVSSLEGDQILKVTPLSL